RSDHAVCEYPAPRRRLNPHEFYQPLAGWWPLASAFSHGGHTPYKWQKNRCVIFFKGAYKMKFMNVLPVLLAVVLSACGTSATQKINTASAAQQQGTVLRFAVLGDAEPKPKAEFPGVAAAVQDINTMAENSRLDFVVGVGDIAHKGTLLQYDNVTPVLQQLSLPFYPIMGNEEHGSTVERFLEYANRWNNGKAMINSPRYIQEYDSVALVYASPDFGRDFNDDGV